MPGNGYNRETDYILDSPINWDCHASLIRKINSNCFFNLKYTF